MSFPIQGYNSLTSVPLTRTINNKSLMTDLVLDGNDFEIPKIGNATINTLVEYLNSVGFTGRIYGGTITDIGSGNVSVSSGYGLIRTTNSGIGTIKSFDWPTSSVNTLTNASVNYIVVNYNGGDPIVTSTTDRSSITFTDIFPLGRVYKSNSTLSIINTGIDIDNFAGRSHLRSLDVDGFAHVSGALVSNPSLLKISTSEGKYYLGLNSLTTPAKNTNAPDTFVYWYRNGTSWNQITNQTSIDPSHYDDGSGTLQTVNNAKYSVHWVYIAYDGSLHVQYGQGGTYSLATASSLSPPSPPPILASFADLAAKIITLKTATTITQIQSAYDNVFNTTNAGDHSALSNLEYLTSGHTGFVPNTLTINNYPLSSNVTLTYTDISITYNKFLSVSDAIIPVTNGPTVSQNETSTYKLNYKYTSFPTSATPTYLQWIINLDNWTKTTIKVTPILIGTTSDTGNISLSFSSTFLSPSLIDHDYGTSVISTTTYTSANTIIMGTKTALITPSGTPSSLISIKVSRTSDTFNSSINLIGIIIEYSNK